MLTRHKVKELENHTFSVVIREETLLKRDIEAHTPKFRHTLDTIALKQGLNENRQALQPVYFKGNFSGGR